MKGFYLLATANLTWTVSQWPLFLKRRSREYRQGYIPQKCKVLVETDNMSAAVNR